MTNGVWVLFSLRIIFVLVTMQAQKEAPPDMQCKDKFLLQSVVTGAGATVKDISPEMVLIRTDIQSLMWFYVGYLLSYWFGKNIYRLRKWVYVSYPFSSIRSQGIKSRSPNWGLFMLHHLDPHRLFEKDQRKVLHQGLRYPIMGIWMLLNLHLWVFDFFFFSPFVCLFYTSEYLKTSPSLIGPCFTYAIVLLGFKSSCGATWAPR